MDISIKLFFGLTTCKLLCVKQYCVALTGESVISEQSLPRWHSLILQPCCLIMQILQRVLKEKAGISNCVDLLVYIQDTSNCCDVKLLRLFVVVITLCNCILHKGITEFF